MAETEGGISLGQVQALITSQVPMPASAMPPGVADTGSIGTQTAFYALANHTHASKVRKERRIGIATSTFTWTYPTPFGAGVVPVISAIAEDPANSAVDSYNVQVVGAPSATAAQLRIIRYSTGLLSLLTGALSINGTPGNINLHLIALEP